MYLCNMPCTIILSVKIVYQLQLKKGGQVDVALLYSRLQVDHCIMDGIKFEFNDIISLYTKNDSDRRRVFSLGYFIQY